MEQLRDTQRPPRILRLREVRARTGRSTSSIYQDMRDGLFPRPVSLGGASVGWIEAEVSRWIEARIAERDGAKATP